MQANLAVEREGGLVGEREGALGGLGMLRQAHATFVEGHLRAARLHARSQV